MNEIAIVICNYNGGMDTIECIQAIKASTLENYDIIVVDNASEDNSLELLSEYFKNEIMVLRNVENLGGSGGFGRGMNYAVEQGYNYIAAVDNDAFVNQDTLSVLYKYLCEHKEVGIAGAKVLALHEPTRITEYAPTLNFDYYGTHTLWNWKEDGADSEEPRECDFVATTTAMATREALLVSGGMDKEYFIYFDDVDLGYQIKKAGYKVMAVGTAKVWHKSGLMRSTSTFGRYYYNRNRYRFFARIIPESEIEKFAEYVLFECFTFMYGSHYKNRQDLFETTKYILEDFIRDIRGKAGENRIWKFNYELNPDLIRSLKSEEQIILWPEENISENDIQKYVRRLRRAAPKANVIIRMDGITGSDDVQSNKKIVQLVEHVKNLKKVCSQNIYMDIHNNVVVSENDFIYFRNFDNSYKFFKHIFWDAIIEGIKKIRAKG